MTEVVYAKITDYLDKNYVDYTEIEHQPAASALEYQKILGTNLEEQAKALLLRYKKPGEKGFFVVTIQAQKQVNLDVLKELTGVSKLKIAQKEQLVKETGCKFGELPPFGEIFGMKLLMDKDLLEQKQIYFNAGLLTTSMTIDPRDLRKLEEPVLF